MVPLAPAQPDGVGGHPPEAQCVFLDPPGVASGGGQVCLRLFLDMPFPHSRTRVLGEGWAGPLLDCLGVPIPHALLARHSG